MRRQFRVLLALNQLGSGVSLRPSLLLLAARDFEWPSTWSCAPKRRVVCHIANALIGHQELIFQSPQSANGRRKLLAAHRPICRGPVLARAGSNGRKAVMKAAQTHLRLPPAAALRAPAKPQAPLSLPLPHPLPKRLRPPRLLHLPPASHRQRVGCDILGDH